MEGAAGVCPRGSSTDRDDTGCGATVAVRGGPRPAAGPRPRAVRAANVYVCEVVISHYTLGCNELPGAARPRPPRPARKTEGGAKDATVLRGAGCLVFDSAQPVCCLDGLLPSASADPLAWGKSPYKPPNMSCCVGSIQVLSLYLYMGRVDVVLVVFLDTRLIALIKTLQKHSHNMFVLGLHIAQGCVHV